MTYRVLLINPNTSPWVTEGLVRQIRQTLPADTAVRIDAATATLGASYIASEVAYALAAHALLDAYAAHFDQHDAVAIGCFGDPGGLALEQISPATVIGMAQASMQEAAAGGKFAIVTGGAAWGPMLRRLAQSLQTDANLTEVIAVDRSAADMAQDRPAAIELLAQACQQAADQGADQIILGGAAFAGYGDELADKTGLAIIDSVSSFARRLEVEAAQTRLSADVPGNNQADTARFSGVSPALLKLLNS